MIFSASASMRLVGLSAALLSSGFFAPCLAKPAFKSSEITIRSKASTGTLDYFSTALPVMGNQKNKIKNNVMIINENHLSKKFKTVLSTKIPIKLNLNLENSRLHGDLRKVQISKLNAKLNNSKLGILLPQHTLHGKIAVKYGGLSFAVPENTGVRIKFSNLNPGKILQNKDTKITYEGAKMVLSTYNYAVAKHKIELEIEGEQTIFSLAIKPAVACCSER